MPKGNLRPLRCSRVLVLFACCTPSVLHAQEEGGPLHDDGGILAGSLVTALVLLLLLFIRYVERERTSRTIEQKNQELEETLKELQESEKRYLRLFMDPTIGKIVLDPLEETIIDANKPARRLLGRSSRQPIADVAIADLECEWLSRMVNNAATDSKDSRTVVEAFEHVQNGVVRYYEAWVSPLTLSGRPAALLTLNDVTERRRLEEERVRKEERERYISELEARKAEVESRNAEMERFIYTVSHDLKSPLVTIRGFLGYLKIDVAQGATERVETDFRHVDGAVTKMGRLLDELLELSRIGRVVNPPQNVSMTELAKEVTDLLSTRIIENGVTVDITPDLPAAYGDRERLGEVLQNLIENAVKFMGAASSPRIEIAWRPGKKGPVYVVRDNGSGIEPQYHERVFDLFDRLDSAVDGSGVGLALVKRIVEVHGGSIWIESEGKDMGSTFCFTLGRPKKSPSSTRSRAA